MTDNDNNNSGGQSETLTELNDRISQKRKELELETEINKAEGLHKKLLEERNKLREIELKLIEAIKNKQDDESERLQQQLNDRKEAIASLEKEIKLREQALEIGKNYAKQLISVNNQILQQSIEMGSFSAAASKAAEGFVREFGSLRKIATLGIDKLLNNTKELVLALDKQQAAFVQNTGASREFADNAFRTRSELAFLGIAGNDAVETMGRLYSQMSEFSQLSQATQRDFVALSAQIERLGGNAGEMGQVFTKVANMDISQTGMAMQRVAGIADAVGIPLSQLSSEIAGMGELFAKMGDQALDTFAGLTAAAKETGLSVQELYGIVGQYDDFNNAAAAAGRLNMVLGGNLIDTYSLLSATEEERVALLQQTLEASGRTFEELDRFEKIELASALNIPLQQAAQLFNTTSGEVQKTAAEIMHANMTSEELAQRTRDAATAQDKLNVLMGNFAILVAPIVEEMNKVVDVFLSFTEAITGGDGIAAAALTLTAGLSSLYLISKLVGLSMGVAFKTAAKSISTSAPAISSGLGSIGASAGGAAAGVGSFALGVLAIGAAVAGVILSLGYLVGKIGEIAQLGPEAAGAFFTISSGVMVLAGALTVLGNPLAVGGLITLGVSLRSIQRNINKLDINKVESFANVLRSLSSILTMPNVGNSASQIAAGIGEISDAINDLPDDQTKAITFAATADALTNLTNAASTIEEAKLASMAALVQAMTNAEGDNGVGQLANAIQNLITSNAEGREMTIELDGYNLGRWIDRRETRNARIVVSGQNG